MSLNVDRRVITLFFAGDMCHNTKTIPLLVLQINLEKKYDHHAKSRTETWMNRFHTIRNLIDCAKFATLISSLEGQYLILNI